MKAAERHAAVKEKLANPDKTPEQWSRDFFDTLPVATYMRLLEARVFYEAYLAYEDWLEENPEEVITEPLPELGTWPFCVWPPEPKNPEQVKRLNDIREFWNLFPDGELYEGDSRSFNPRTMLPIGPGMQGL